MAVEVHKKMGHCRLFEAPYDEIKGIIMFYERTSLFSLDEIIVGVALS